MKYYVTIACDSAARFEIEADNIEEAEEKAEDMINDESFFEKFREDCDFFDPNVTHTFLKHNNN